MPRRGTSYRIRAELTARQYHATLTWFTRAMKSNPRTEPAAIAGVQKMYDGLVNAFWHAKGLYATPDPTTETRDND